MALTKTDVSALYVAIFNRASEGEGNTFWQTAGTSAEVASAMLETDPAKEYFGAALDDDQAFVEHIYLNTLGKTLADDAEGIAYWVGELATQSRGEVIARLVESAQDPANAGAAQDLFLNMVAVSDYTADTLDNAPANLDSVRFDKGLAGVTADKATVDVVKEIVDGIAKVEDTGPLSEALSDYQDAVAAERAFLEAVAERDEIPGVDEDSTNDQIILAIGTVVTAATGMVSDQLTALAGELTGTAKTTITAYAGSFAGASPAVKAEIIAEAKTEATKLVQAAQAEVSKISGQLSKVNALVSAKTSYEAALDAKEKAEGQAEAELAKFNSLTGESASIDRADADSYAVGTLITVGARGLQIADAAKSLEGIDALFAAAQVEYQALLAAESAKDTFEARLISAHNGEAAEIDAISAVAAGTDYTITGATAVAGTSIAIAASITDEMVDSAALLEARGLESDLSGAINGYQTIAGVSATLVGLQAGVKDAAEAIEELDYELAQVVAGTPDSAAGTDADDLFVFTENELTISGFGLEGNDLLFIGEGFAEVRVAAGDDTVTDRLGNASELEIFFQQDGNNALIYVEQETFAGNATNAADLVQITLQGVNIDDLQYDNGFITIA